MFLSRNQTSCAVGSRMRCPDHRAASHSLHSQLHPVPQLAIPIWLQQPQFLHTWRAAISPSHSRNHTANYPAVLLTSVQSIVPRLGESSCRTLLCCGKTSFLQAKQFSCKRETIFSEHAEVRGLFPYFPDTVFTCEQVNLCIGDSQDKQ